MDVQIILQQDKHIRLRCEILKKSNKFLSPAIYIFTIADALLGWFLFASKLGDLLYFNGKSELHSVGGSSGGGGVRVFLQNTNLLNFMQVFGNFRQKIFV